jgi:hypothetical protein
MAKGKNFISDFSARTVFLRTPITFLLLLIHTEPLASGRDITRPLPHPTLPNGALATVGTKAPVSTAPVSAILASLGQTAVMEMSSALDK